MDLERLQRDLISLSYRKTTGLSGNLIECAARGEADERLLALVDSIFSGAPSVELGALPMLTWGSSFWGRPMIQNGRGGACRDGERTAPARHGELSRELEWCGPILCAGCEA